MSLPQWNPCWFIKFYKPMIFLFSSDCSYIILYTPQWWLEKPSTHVDPTSSISLESTGHCRLLRPQYSSGGKLDDGSRRGFARWTAWWTAFRLVNGVAPNHPVMRPWHLYWNNMRQPWWLGDPWQNWRKPPLGSRRGLWYFGLFFWVLIFSQRDSHPGTSP